MKKMGRDLDHVKVLGHICTVAHHGVLGLWKHRMLS